MEKAQTTTEILERLVAFPTVSDRSNLDLIDYAEQTLRESGARTGRLFDASGQKASLWAQIGPETAGGVILSGHTDVVPVAGQDWTDDPFRLTRRDGRLYGRGAADMKGFVAAALSAAPRFAAADLKRPVQFALTYDEEVGCIAAPPLIEEMGRHLPRAAATIVGEPSEMGVVTGQKGIAELHVHVRGFEVHSSLMHTGVPAVMVAARLIGWLDAAHEAARAAAPPPVPGGFDPPWTTLHVGTISGGTAHNITARDCRFSLDVRPVPPDSTAARIAAFREQAEELTAEIRRIHPDAGVTVTVNADVPAMAPQPDNVAELLVRRLTGDNANRSVAYAAEAGQFQEAGYPTVICGPGSIEQAHQGDEWIAESELAAADAFMDRLAESLSA